MCQYFFLCLKVNQKLAISLAAVLILGFGIAAFTAGIQARSDDKYEKVATMIAAEDNDSFDVDAACLAMLIIGAISVIGSLAGCYGAWAEHRGAICGFACFLIAIGGVLLGVMMQMLIYFKSTVPTLIRETNRLCRNPVRTKEMLECPALNAPQTPTGNVLPTSSARRLTASFAMLAGSFDANLRLKSLITTTQHPMLNSSMVHFNLNAHGIGVAPLMYALDDESLQRTSLLHALATESQAQDTSPRRLDPGTTERNFISSLCDRLKLAYGAEACTSKCELIDSICVTPEGFNEATACVCDPNGPQKLKIPTQTGAEATELEPAQCPPSMEDNGVCEGYFCSIPQVRANEGLTDEGCWVRPGTLCGASDDDDDKLPGTPWPGTDPYKNAYWSSGPCYDPDPRSDVVVTGAKLGLAFIAMTTILGALMICTSFCAGCLFCELHTGRKADDHARDILYGGDNDDGYSSDGDE